MFGGTHKAVVVDISVTLIHSWLIVVILMLLWINNSLFQSEALFKLLYDHVYFSAFSQNESVN